MMNFSQFFLIVLSCGPHFFQLLISSLVSSVFSAHIQFMLPILWAFITMKIFSVHISYWSKYWRYYHILSVFLGNKNLKINYQNSFEHYTMVLIYRSIHFFAFKFKHTNNNIHWDLYWPFSTKMAIIFHYHLNPNWKKREHNGIIAKRIKFDHESISHLKLAGQSVQRKLKLS